ncbi:MAG: isoaspartyl peptidase/L-asparaginase [Microscillaceae bacterium]|jgi:beta-aspartyl-peptidase (threonine type)|nr:isoaspartyl peptidase/L-asparaginase [Microscillaceae bacterium]
MKYSLILIFSILTCLSTFAQKDKITLVIHGGAGTILKENMTPELEKAYHDKMQEALRKGYEILKNGGKSLDAVTEVIKILEDSPLFNAGKGAVFSADGKNELDASVMDGATLKAGSCASVMTVKNPITLARRIMENSPHVMLIGRGAEKFAQEQGLTIVPNEYFQTETRLKQLKKEKGEKIKEKNKKKDKDDSSLLDQMPQDKFGTVGCVALDEYGNIVAGTSTGGMSNKKWNRVGDSPIIGAGTYANNQTCGVSATGHGEYFIRAVVAYDISALMEYQGMSLEQAANRVVMEKLVKMGGEGGIVALDKNGNIAMPFNSPGMYRGYIKADGQAQTFIYK